MPVPTSSGNKKVYAGVLTAFVFSVLFMFVMHPRLAVRDVDGYAYIMGARSLHIGNGYRSLTGEEFNHWPPGYSLLLSIFNDPMQAALVLNYLSFGLATGLIYLLLRRQGWEWQAAAGFTLAMGSGFLRLLANQVHPDILTYALFLLGICLARRGPSRMAPGLIWAVLVPVKFIALVFLPAAAAADKIAARMGWKQLVRSYLGVAVATGITLGGVLVFNARVVRTWLPTSHGASSLKTLAAGTKSFIVTIPRSFLFDWHGSVSPPFPRIAFGVCLLLAAVCLCLLRPTQHGRWLRVCGVWCLIFSAVLLCVRSYDPAVRLTGYGLIILIAGFRPVKAANWFWILYGLASLATGAVNAVTVNSLGSDDPRYADLAGQFRASYAGTGTVATNSFHILDLHANVPSFPVTAYSEAGAYEKFFWVTLPVYDEGASAVTPMAHPGPEWCSEKAFAGGELFTRCQSGSPGVYGVGDRERQPSQPGMKPGEVPQDRAR